MTKRRTRRWSSRELAKTIARLVDEKQATHIVILDVAEAIQVADYFVICDGTNRRHLGVLGEHVARELKKEGIYRMGGSPAADENWVLLDFGPVVLHAFSPTGRAYYDLDNLWGDCPKVRWRRLAKKKPAEGAVLAPALGAATDDAPAADESAVDATADDASA